MDVILICTIVMAAGAAVGAIEIIRRWKKRDTDAPPVLPPPDYRIRLDEFTEELKQRAIAEERLDVANMSLATREEQLRVALEEVARLRKELQAIEARELDDAGLPAQPAKGALESPQQKQARADIEQKLAKVVDHFTLGYKAALREDWPKALEHFEAALAEKRTVAVLNNLASMYVLMSRFNMALKLYGEAEELCRRLNLPYLDTICMNCGVVYSNLGRYEEALAAYARAEELRREQGLPEDWQSAGNRGVVYGTLGRWDDELEEIDKAETLRREQGLPENAGLAMNRGVVYQNLGRYDEALGAYSRAEELRREQGLPLDPGLPFNQATVYRALKQPEQALLAYDESECRRRALNWPDDPDIDWGRAQNLKTLGRMAEARECARRALALYEQIEKPTPDGLRRLVARLAQMPDDTSES